MNPTEAPPVSEQRIGSSDVLPVRAPGKGNVISRGRIYACVHEELPHHLASRSCR